MFFHRAQGLEQFSAVSLKQAKRRKLPANKVIKRWAAPRLAHNALEQSAFSLKQAKRRKLLANKVIKRWAAPRLAHNALAAIGLAALLAGCAGVGSGGSAPAAGPAATFGPLPTAETLAADLVMAPVARDAGGCVQYRMQSNKRPTVDAFFYRTRFGDFSTIRKEAACT